MGGIGNRVWVASIGVAMGGLAGCGGEAAEPPAEPSAQFVRLEESGAAPEPTPPIEQQAAPAPAVEATRPPAPQATAPEVAAPAPDEQPMPARGSAGERERSALAALDAGEFASASRQLSAMLVDAIRSDSASPEQLRSWSGALDRAQAGHRWSRRGSWPSLETTVQSGDSLIAIRARVLTANPGLLLSTGLVARANQLASETSIRPGEVLRIPTDRPSAIVDISSRWVLYLLGDEVAASWEVGVGKDTTPTRPGRYTVGLKQKEPMWSPVGRDPVPYGDPQNPLGTRWLAWFEDGRNTSLGFHGTNDASGVGRAVSDGCVRMRNADVELLFEILPKDASVLVQP